MWTGEKGRERTERALNDYVTLAGGVAAGVQCVIDMDHSRPSFALIRPIQTRTFSCNAMAGFVPWLCAAQSTLLSPLSPRTVCAAAAAVPPPGHCPRRPLLVATLRPHRIPDCTPVCARTRLAHIETCIRPVVGTAALNACPARSCSRPRRVLASIHARAVSSSASAALRRPALCPGRHQVPFNFDLDIPPRIYAVSSTHITTMYVLLL